MARRSEELWIPDNPDGSGWADVDWVSAVYRIVTRLDTPLLHAPHENSYYVPQARLADFLTELALAGGDETIWHIEPCPAPPPESRAKP